MAGTEDSLFRIGEKISHLFHGSIPEILSETVFHAGLFFLDFQVGRMKALEGVKQIKLPVREKKADFPQGGTVCLKNTAGAELCRRNRLWRLTEPQKAGGRPRWSFFLSGMCRKKR